MYTDYEQTILYYQVAYASEYLYELERDAGLEHPNTIQQLNKISKLTNQAGMHQDALKYTRELYNRCIKTYGDSHPYTLEAKLRIDELIRHK